eukprot:2524574-Ditylum_brightwellii.AAC.1
MTTMTVTETMIMNLEILPQSLSDVVVNDHNEDDEADNENKDDAGVGDRALGYKPVPSLLHCEKDPMEYKGKEMTYP